MVLRMRSRAAKMSSKVIIEPCAGFYLHNKTLPQSLNVPWRYCRSQIIRHLDYHSTEMAEVSMQHGTGVQFAVVGYRAYCTAKEKWLQYNAPADWFLQDIRP